MRSKLSEKQPKLPFQSAVMNSKELQAFQSWNDESLFSNCSWSPKNQTRVGINKSHLHLTATLKESNGYLVVSSCTSGKKARSIRVPREPKSLELFSYLVDRIWSVKVNFKKRQRSCKTSNLVAIQETSCVLNNGLRRLLLERTRPRKKY